MPVRIQGYPLSGREDISLGMWPLFAEDHGNVSMTMKTKMGVEKFKSPLGHQGVGNILPDGSAEATMNQGIVVLNEGLREALQIGSILCGQFFCCPLTGLPSGGVELGGIHLADGRPIVVSGHAAEREFSQADDTLVGVGPIAD